MMKIQSKAEILRASRRRDRQKRHWRLLAGLLLAAVLTGLSVAAFSLPFLRVTGVTVSGETGLGQEAVENFVRERLSGRYLGLIPKNSIFFITDNILSEAEFKERFPGLAEVTVTWPNLNTLAVAVTDRQSKILWCVVAETAKQCYYLSPSGLVYQTAPNFSDSVLTEFHTDQPVEKLRQQVIEARDLTRVLSVVAFVRDHLAGWSFGPWRLSHLEVKPERDFVLVMTQEDRPGSVTRVIFNADRAVNDIATDLNSVLSNEEFLAEWRAAGGRLEYLDLRFAGKVFYRFRP